MVGTYNEISFNFLKCIDKFFLQTNPMFALILAEMLGLSSWKSALLIRNLRKLFCMWLWKVKRQRKKLLLMFCNWGYSYICIQLFLLSWWAHIDSHTLVPYRTTYLIITKNNFSDSVNTINYITKAAEGAENMSL